MALGNPGVCKGCLRPIVWRINDNGKRQPFDPDGTPHHATCRFRPARPAPAKQTAQPGLWAESRRLPIQTSRCAGCAELLIWHPTRGLVDLDDGAPHEYTCPALRRSERTIYEHTERCKHCPQDTPCQVVTTRRGELHRCVGCKRWRLIINPAVTPRGGPPR